MTDKNSNKDIKKRKMVDIARPEKKSEKTSDYFNFKEFKKEFPKEKREKEEAKEIKTRETEEVKIEELEFSKNKFNHFKEPELINREIRKERKKNRRSWKMILIFIIVGFLVYLALCVLPRVEVDLTLKKVPLELSQEIVATTAINSPSVSDRKIPAELFTQTKNNVLSFHATGKKNVERKARGEVTIYNSYSSESQRLVANTRLLAPDGKIFRLEESIVVPGAKIVEGKIIPSSIKATVVADKAGQEYNIGPVDHFTIPGFQGSEKYEGFYAKSESAMAGGFVGEIPVPTEDDIKQAKEKAENSLKDYFIALFYAQIPKDFKILDEAKQFQILKEEVNKEVDNQGNFSVMIEAKASAIGFRENDILTIFTSLAKKDLGENFKLKNYEISYANISVGINQGNLSFLVNFKGEFEPPFNIDEFKQKIMGKNELEIKTLIFSQSGIEKAKVNLWPFWLKKVPNNTNKIKIIIE